jgi:hypothetical protein
MTDNWIMPIATRISRQIQMGISIYALGVLVLNPPRTKAMIFEINQKARGNPMANATKGITSPKSSPIYAVVLERKSDGKEISVNIFLIYSFYLSPFDDL